ncbi:RING-H2 finger protein ATL1 [Platanthera zijinensis]|uniref:RING-H2 finger protein ATL1 n=1 Tax=Platanthera zijinensis TaxID=2320716 RepID=A0AAP0BCC4_9ASPA
MIPKKVILLLYLLDLILYSFSALLYRLGLNPSFETEPAPWDNPEHLFIAADLKPLETTPDTIKSLLPVLEFQSLVKKQGKSPLPAPECAVCLQFIEARDRVRELGKCCHAFHAECMDRWLDLGRLSCPLCRSAVAGEVDGQNGPLRVLKVLLRGC